MRRGPGMPEAATAARCRWRAGTLERGVGRSTALRFFLPLGAGDPRRRRPARPVGELMASANCRLFGGCPAPLLRGAPAYREHEDAQDRSSRSGVDCFGRRAGVAAVPGGMGDARPIRAGEGTAVSARFGAPRGVEGTPPPVGRLGGWHQARACGPGRGLRAPSWVGLCTRRGGLHPLWGLRAPSGAAAVHPAWGFAPGTGAVGPDPAGSAPAAGANPRTGCRPAPHTGRFRPRGGCKPPDRVQPRPAHRPPP